MTVRSGSGPNPRQTRYRFDEEPTLQELIDDPVMQAVMARDGVERAALFNLVIEVRTRLTRREPVAELLCD